MNSKNPGKDLLIDDASLKTEDGGIVGGGGVDPEPEQGNLVTNPGFENWTGLYLRHGIMQLTILVSPKKRQ